MEENAIIDSSAPLQPAPSLDLFEKLEARVHDALATYANVHRGSGHASLVTTLLYEEARQTIHRHLALHPKKDLVIFCSSGRAARLKATLKEGSWKECTSEEIGLALGVHCLGVNRAALPTGTPLEPGGGTTKLVGNDWIIWADAPDRFEGGTPAIINVIAFVCALKLLKDAGQTRFHREPQGGVLNILYQSPLLQLHGQPLMDALLPTRIGKDLLVPTTRGSKSYIHLDHSASTPSFEPVWDAFRTTLRQGPTGQRNVVDETRQIVHRFLEAPMDTYQAVFTSGTTEAVHLAALILPSTILEDVEPVILCSTLEHSSNDLPWRNVPGGRVLHLPTDEQGVFDLNEMARLLSEYNRQHLHGKQRIVLVAVTGASNVLGTCNDIGAVARLAHGHGARIFVDAAQLAAHRPIFMLQDDIDCLAFSAHKLYAPFGSGALMVKKDLLRRIPLQVRTQLPLGETNSAGIAAMGMALLLLEKIGMNHIALRESQLMTHALAGLRTVPDLRIYGHKGTDECSPTDKVGVIAFDIKGAMPGTTAAKLAFQWGIGVRHGCHCAHLAVKNALNIGPRLATFQRVLQRLIPPLKLQGVVRISFGLETTEADIDALITALQSHASSPGTHPSRPLSLKEAKGQSAAIALSTAQRLFHAAPPHYSSLYSLPQPF